jgi:hypothetical protein
MGINYGLNKVRFPAPVPVGLHSADELCLGRLGVGRGRGLVLQRHLACRLTLQYLWKT